jgi:hypothetical protein
MTTVWCLSFCHAIMLALLQSLRLSMTLEAAPASMIALLYRALEITVLLGLAAQRDGAVQLASMGRRKIPSSS